MKKVFITGGAGFIGSHVVSEFVKSSYKVYIYDTFRQYLLPSPDEQPYNLLTRLSDVYEKIDLVQGDTLNKDFLRRALNRIRPDIIVHTASLPLAVAAIEHSEEAFESILNSSVNIMEIMRDFNHKSSMVYISSSMVYGDFTSSSVKETDPTDPKDIYGSLKLAGEIICRGYMKRYNLDIRIVRPSAVYGPYDANQRVLYKFITKALNGEKISIDGDGSMKLDFTYVKDTARGIYLVATHKKASHETFNITRGCAESLKEAIRIITCKLGNVKIVYKKAPAHIPKRGTLNISKARTLLGYKPKYNLNQGLTNYIEHLKSNII